MASVNSVSKRISSITPLDLEHKPVKVDDDTWLAYSQHAGWDRWYTQVDNDQTPDVSRSVSMGRIALRDQSSGKIYSSELPSYIDDMVYGQLTVNSVQQTATFTDVEAGDDRRVTYTTGETIPANLTFVDTVQQVQYRYVATEERTYEGNVQYGFVRITMSNITPKGWLVVDDYNEGNLVKCQVRAVLPQLVKFGTCDTWYDVTDSSGKGLFVDENKISIPSRAADEREDVVHVARVQGDAADTYQKLTNTVYRVIINVQAKPKARSDYISTLSLVLNGNIVSTADVDMSIPSGATQSVCLMGDVDLRNNETGYEWVNNKSLTVRLQADPNYAIQVKCIDGGIAELI